MLKRFLTALVLVAATAGITVAFMSRINPPGCACGSNCQCADCPYDCCGRKVK